MPGVIYEFFNPSPEAKKRDPILARITTRSIDPYEDLFRKRGDNQIVIDGQLIEGTYIAVYKYPYWYQLQK